MSRQPTAAQRNLTLTEELEKLEQSITLTLQEIDHNFSRAHRIVTTSILPIVENYREHSNQVWEGSKFWKHFFEASANVSLSGYEEPPPEGSEVEGDEYEEGGTTTVSPSAASAQATPSSASYVPQPVAQNGGEDEATMTPNNNNQYSTTATAGSYTPSPSQTTPRPLPKSTRTPKANPTASKAPYTSTYSALKGATLGSNPSEPSTPRAQAQASPSKPAQPQEQQLQSSPFAPPSSSHHAAHRTPSNNDVFLHRVLDKTWRIQATPHSTARLPYRDGIPHQQESPAKPSTARKTAHQQQQQRRGLADSDDLDSSPAAPAPELHAEIFDTPARKGTTRMASVGRVPGVSVLTPAKQGMGSMKTSTPAWRAGGEDEILWDSDDDDEVEGGMSPPKTMQFHVPASRLVQTPAREASKRIVEDLLLTAGMNDGLEEAEEEGSPSIVKTGGLLEEDTF